MGGHGWPVVAAAIVAFGVAFSTRHCLGRLRRRLNRRAAVSVSNGHALPALGEWDAQRTLDYKQHGTTSLFAALDARAGP